MIILVNKVSLMGTYKNSRLFNAIAWTTAIVVGGITLLSVYQTITNPS